MDLTHGEIADIVEPMLDAAGFELVDLVIAAGRRPIIRVFIHRDGGITIDDCANVSRMLEFELDAADAFGRRYNLEVSSPGLERPLKQEGDFKRNIGEEVRLFMSGEDGRSFERCGIIKACDDAGLTLEIEGVDNVFGWEMLIQGKLVY